MDAQPERYYFSPFSLSEARVDWKQTYIKIKGLWKVEEIFLIGIFLQITKKTGWLNNTSIFNNTTLLFSEL